MKLLERIKLEASGDINNWVKFISTIGVIFIAILFTGAICIFEKISKPTATS